MFGVSGCGQTVAGLTSIMVSPSSATVGINKTQAFLVIAYYGNNSTAFVTPDWSLSGSVGSISSSGTFTATAEGVGRLTATYQGCTSTASISVTSKGFIAGKVRELSSSTGIPNIRVYISEEATYYSISAANGSYSISDVTPGRYTLVAQGSKDYLPTTASVVVATAESTTQNFSLYSRVSFYTGGIPTAAGDYVSVTGTVKNLGTLKAYGIYASYTFYYDSEFGPLPISRTTVTSPYDITTEGTGNFTIAAVYVPNYNGTYTRRITVTSIEAE